MESWGDAPRPFCVTRVADPFGDIDRPPYDAVRNLTESGELPELFAELPNAKTDEINWVSEPSRPPLSATVVAVTAAFDDADPTS